MPGGSNIAPNMAAILAGMARYQHCGALVLLLSDAAAHWSLRVDPDRLGHNRRATAHWENPQNLRHEGCDLKLEDSLFVQEERLTTCAGMCSAADALLDLDKHIREDLEAAVGLKGDVAQVMVKL